MGIHLAESYFVLASYHDAGSVQLAGEVPLCLENLTADDGTADWSSTH